MLCTTALPRWCDEDEDEDGGEVMEVTFSRSMMGAAAAVGPLLPPPAAVGQVSTLEERDASPLPRSTQQDGESTSTAPSPPSGRLSGGMWMWREQGNLIPTILIRGRIV